MAIAKRWLDLGNDIQVDHLLKERRSGASVA
jgi:hypothetical protein